MRSLWLSPVIFLITLVPNCSTRCPSGLDETPPRITIDSPDIDDFFCEVFTVEGHVSDEETGVERLKVLLDGEIIESVELYGAHSYYFEFDVGTGDFPADCGEVEMSVVAWDEEWNESSEKVDVILCDDSVEPVVAMAADETVLTSENQCTVVTVSIDDENLDFWRIPETYLSGTESEFDFPVCGWELQVGENTLNVIAWDYCGNEGIGALTITYSPDIP